MALSFTVVKEKKTYNKNMNFIICYCFICSSKGIASALATRNRSFKKS